MRKRSWWAPARLLFGLLGVGAAGLSASVAHAQNCPGVAWQTGSFPGERIYTCHSQFSTSRTPGGQTPAQDDDGAAIQDALDRTLVAGCPNFPDSVGNGTRIVTVRPGPSGSHGGACVIRRPIVLGSNRWLRGLRTGQAGAPTILKVDYNSTTFDPNNNFGGNADGAATRVIDMGAAATAPFYANVSVSDLEIDGSAIPIQKLVRIVNNMTVPVCQDNGCEQGHGILLTSVRGASLRSVTVHDVNGDGIYIHGGSTDVSLLDSKVYRAQRVGINFDGAAHAVIAGNRIWSVPRALATENHTGNITHDVLAHNVILPGPLSGDDRLDPPPVAGDPPAPVTSIGIELVGAQFGGIEWSKSIVSKNRIDLRSGTAIHVGDYRDFIVAANQFDNRGQAIGDDGRGVHVVRSVAGMLVSNNIFQGIQETTPAVFCTLPGAGSEPINAAININGTVGVNARANVVHDSVTALRNLAMQAEQVSFVDNIAVGRVPAANASPASQQIHWGVEMQGGKRLLISDNIIAGYDRQMEFTSWEIASLNVSGNLLRGGAVGRPLPSAVTGSLSESAGVTFDEASNANSMEPFSLLANIAAPETGGSTFLPVRHAQTFINAGYALGTGELELGRNIGMDAMTYVFWTPGSNVACPTEQSRASTPLQTVSPGFTTVGTATLSGTATQVSVAFAAPLPNATYRVVAQPSATTGAAAAAAARVAEILSRTTTGFTLKAEAAPGAGASTTFEWMVFP